MKSKSLQTQVAKEIRAELNEKFPETEFSVRPVGKGGLQWVTVTFDFSDRGQKLFDIEDIILSYEKEVRVIIAHKRKKKTTEEKMEILRAYRANQEEKRS